MRLRARQTVALPILAAMCVLAGLPAATAQSTGSSIAQREASRLEACIARIDEDASAAYEDGLAWMAEGGRPAARHCTALALIELGLVAEGAARLEQLANADDAGGLGPRTVYLAQAGNAWLLARNPEAARIAFTNALKLDPTNADLKKDRARAYIWLGAWSEAAVDLNAAIASDPRDAEALRLRGQSLLALGRLDDAMADVERAMVIAPADIDVLVLRGQVREAQRLAADQAAGGASSILGGQPRVTLGGGPP